MTEPYSSDSEPSDGGQLELDESETSYFISRDGECFPTEDRAVVHDAMHTFGRGVSRLSAFHDDFERRVASSTRVRAAREFLAAHASEAFLLPPLQVPGRPSNWTPGPGEDWRESWLGFVTAAYDVVYAHQTAAIAAARRVIASLEPDDETDVDWAAACEVIAFYDAALVMLADVKHEVLVDLSRTEIN